MSSPGACAEPLDHGEGTECSEGVPSLELTENALTAALLCRRTVGSKFGCLRACLLQHIHSLLVQGNNNKLNK